METFEVPYEMGEKILRAMGFDGFAILNPENQENYLMVARYLAKFDDGAMIAQMVTNGTPASDKAGKLMEYVMLRKELDEVRQQLAELPSEDLVSGQDEQAEEMRRELESAEAMLIEQIAQYE